jgi:Bacterial regulatory helix-turn-helix protein, lysR family
MFSQAATVDVPLSNPVVRIASSLQRKSQFEPVYVRFSFARRMILKSSLFSEGMKFRHLEFFVAAAEELNFTRAAARLNVSQPPFSKQIHDLEAELGIKLFQRHQKGVALTAAARV